jgi:hypothetical protein
MLKTGGRNFHGSALPAARDASFLRMSAMAGENCKIA